MAACSGIKPDGSRCKGIPTTGSDYCPAHDPHRAEARKRAASKAARSRPSQDQELPGIKTQLQELTRDVLAGDLETGRAAVANQLINTRLRAIEVERKVKETDELEARIEELERGGGRGAKPWGA